MPDKKNNLLESNRVRETKEKLNVTNGLYCILFECRSILIGKLKTESFLTVLEMSSVFLQYNTGAAATTFVVKAPESGNNEI